MIQFVLAILGLVVPLVLSLTVLNNLMLHLNAIQTTTVMLWWFGSFIVVILTLLKYSSKEMKTDDFFSDGFGYILTILTALTCGIVYIVN